MVLDLWHRATCPSEQPRFTTKAGQHICPVPCSSHPGLGSSLLPARAVHRTWCQPPVTEPRGHEGPVHPQACSPVSLHTRCLLSSSMSPHTLPAESRGAEASRVVPRGVASGAERGRAEPSRVGPRGVPSGAERGAEWCRAEPSRVMPRGRSRAEPSDAERLLQEAPAHIPALRAPRSGCPRLPVLPVPPPSLPALRSSSAGRSLSP